jgi:hypothetical protein
MNQTHVEVKDRFLAKVEIIPEHICWEWSTNKNNKGYGMFYFNGKKQLAHRFSYELYLGEIPKNICVLHKCDNPGCVNPNHLFLGTRKDNAIDMSNKKRAYQQDKTHCHCGHVLEFAGKSKNGRPRRRCKACRELASAAWKLNNPGKVRKYQREWKRAKKQVELQ